MSAEPAAEQPMGKPHFTTAGRMAFRFVWRASKRELLVSVAAEVIAALGLAGVLLFGRQLVLELTGDGPLAGAGDVVPEVVGLGASLLTSGLAAVLVRQYRWLVSEHVTRHIQEEIVEVASRAPYASYEEQQFHDQLMRARNQASQSAYQLVYDVLSLVNVLATSVVVISVLVRTVPEVLVALLAVSVPAVLAARASARLAFQTTYRLTSSDRLRYYLFGALTGKEPARELRVFGVGRVLQDRWAGLYAERMDRIRALALRQLLFNGIAAAIGAVLVGAVLLLLVDAAVSGRIALGDAAVAIVALQQLSGRLRSAAGASGSLRQSTLFLADFEQFRRRHLEEGGRGSDPTPLPRETLSVEHVSFRYPGSDRVVLHDVSVRIDPGEVVALVGLSGSGKSTLAHLVARLYEPTDGRITYGGVDVREIPPQQYWRSLAAVFQDFVRYEMTASDNVTMSDHRRAGDHEAMRAAAARADIDEVLEALPLGFDTMLSRAFEDGAELSVGQWQRVAVARAFFREAPLLILDEPAAALDAVAEQRLYERLVELCSSRSVLLISHRFATVRMADRICFMEGGRIVEEGTHAELMALGGRYAELFNVQAAAYLPSTSA